MNKNLIKIAQVGLILGVLALPLIALADLPGPTVPVGGGGLTIGEVQSIIKLVAQFLIGVGVIIAVIFIIWGGITYMAAGANEELATKAKQRIYNGVIGAAVVLGVGVILQTVANIVTRNVLK